MTIISQDIIEKYLQTGGIDNIGFHESNIIGQIQSRRIEQEPYLRLSQLTKCNLTYHIVLLNANSIDI